MIKCERCKKTRIQATPQVPNPARQDGLETGNSMRKIKTNWRKKHERYFNETAVGSRCSFWTSDKKMEP